MRLYKYRGVPVIESDFLLSWNKNARGFAALFFIVHKNRVSPYFDKTIQSKGALDPMVDYCCNGVRCKAVQAVLKHEYFHLIRQREVGRFKWLWKYIFDKDFHDEEERLACEAEV